MSRTWQVENCKNCTYNVHGFCRRYPPVKVLGLINPEYPQVTILTGYKEVIPFFIKEACAEFERHSIKKSIDIKKKQCKKQKCRHCHCKKGGEHGPLKI